MKLQCALVVVAGLGLAGCGGGGGGGDSDGGTVYATQVKAADLVGTWTQEAEFYLESPTPDEWTWFRTDRQTIIVEQTEAGLRPGGEREARAPGGDGWMRRLPRRGLIGGVCFPSEGVSQGRNRRFAGISLELLERFCENEKG